MNTGRSLSALYRLSGTVVRVSVIGELDGRLTFDGYSNSAHRSGSHDEQARWLARTGTAPALAGRIRFEHAPVHLTAGPTGFSTTLARQSWQAIRCPTLLVDGAESHLRRAPDEAARRRASIPGAEHVTLAGAGHMMQRHRPAELARLLHDCLEVT